MLERVLALTMLAGTLAGASPAAADVAPEIFPEQARTAEVTGHGAGLFQSACTFSHRATDDPIVFPNQPGMAHSHDFIGNRRTNAHSTYDGMVGNPSTCDDFGATAAYWFPTLSNDGVRIKPSVTLVYYRNGTLSEKVEILPIPADLKIIAGSASSIGPQDVRILNWACAGPGPERELDHVPASCSGEPLRLHFSFPNCWDGERLDSRDHQSHMAYAWAGDDDRRECPRSHPVALPTLEFSTRWRIDGPLDGVRLASGSPNTAHADFWNTWVQSEMERLTAECIVARRVCN